VIEHNIFKPIARAQKSNWTVSIAALPPTRAYRDVKRANMQSKMKVIEQGCVVRQC